MQSIDNLTRLKGQVLLRVPHPSLGGYELLTLRVEEAQDVAGRANVLGDRAGQELQVAVPTALLPPGADLAGARVTLRAKMTPNGAMAEPHPEAGDFVIEP